MYDMINDKMRYFAKDGEMVSVWETNKEHTKRIGKRYDAIVLWRKSDSEVLVTPIDKYEPQLHEWTDIVECYGSLDLNWAMHYAYPNLNASKAETEKDRLTIGDIVKHFKRETLTDPGNLYLYKILNIAKHTESNERLVIYQALYENDAMGVHFNVCARPYDMFMGIVDKEKYPDIKQQYRFEKYL